MNTAFILAIIVLGALSAALGAMLPAARREAGHGAHTPPAGEEGCGSGGKQDQQHADPQKGRPELPRQPPVRLPLLGIGGR